MKNNICIISQAPVGYSETFIKAHLDRLEGYMFHLYGYHLNYYENGISLREKYHFRISRWEKLAHLLPHYIYFRIDQKRKEKYSDANLVKRYLEENGIEVVLAEYGTTGSFITPICKSMNIPLIVHFHGFDTSQHRILNRFKEDYLKMFDYASYVVAVSNEMCHTLKQMGCPKEKVIYNPCGPDNSFLEIKPKYNSNQILAIGRQTFKKAPYLTILAFEKVLKECPNLRLAFVGDGEIEEVSKKMIKALHLENNIKLVGKKGREQIVELMKNAFLFVQHSVMAESGDSEGTPVAVLEAMGAGLPVVSTRHAGIPDVVLEGKTGFLVDDGDVDTMANKIIILAQDRKLTEVLGQAAKKRITNYFSMGNHIKVINELVSKL